MDLYEKLISMYFFEDLKFLKKIKKGKIVDLYYERNFKISLIKFKRIYFYESDFLYDIKTTDEFNDVNMVYEIINFYKLKFLNLGEFKKLIDESLLLPTALVHNNDIVMITYDSNNFFNDSIGIIFKIKKGKISTNNISIRNEESFNWKIKTNKTIFIKETGQLLSDYLFEI
ncbi:hypothetical protein [Carp edema virus]|nr:hypothetical protein [Carp edema virus]